MVSSLEEMFYNPWDLNGVTKLETKITKSKTSDQPIDNIPERRTVDSSFSHSKTQSCADSSNSIFKTSESILNDVVPSTSSSEILSPEPLSTRKATPPTEPKAPLSNLAKIIADKKAERAAQPSSNNSTSLSTPQKPVQQTETVQAKQQCSQFSNTVLRYGRFRKQTQHFQSI